MQFFRAKPDIVGRAKTMKGNIVKLIIILSLSLLSFCARPMTREETAKACLECQKNNLKAKVVESWDGNNTVAVLCEPCYDWGEVPFSDKGPH